MRTIKYRGKTKKGEWLYGDLLQVANEVFIAPSDGDWFDFIPWSRNNVFHLPAAKYVVIPETVGQFTGLLDKNGKDIYEGDIISRKYTIGPQCCFSEGKEEINYIGFKQSECKFIVVCTNRHHDLYEPYNIHIEVIGNIHDTPELLNRKNK